MSDRLYKRGAIWWGWFYTIEGQRIPVSLRTSSKTIARKRLRAHETLAADPTPHQRTESLDECLTYYLDVAIATKAAGTQHSYRVKAGHLRRLLDGSTPLGEIDRSVVESYYQARMGEGAAKSTIHKESVVLRQALKVSADRGIYTGQPRVVVPTIRIDYQPRDRWLTREEYDKLLAVTPDHRRTFIMLGCLAGTNLGEAHALEWQHVNLEAGWMRIPGTKRASRWRRVPIAGELAEHLESIPEKVGPVVVPHWRRNNQRDLGVLCARAGIERVTSNDLRRTFASWLKQRGVDSLTVAHLMGHTTTRMVELVYGRLADDTYRDAVALLPRPALKLV